MRGWFFRIGVAPRVPRWDSFSRPNRDALCTTADEPYVKLCNDIAQFHEIVRSDVLLNGPIPTLSRRRFPNVQDGALSQMEACNAQRAPVRGGPLPSSGLAAAAEFLLNHLQS